MKDDLKELEKKYEELGIKHRELGEEIERLKGVKNEWPKTIHEAKSKYTYIGFNPDYGRYLVTVMLEPVSAATRWCSSDQFIREYSEHVKRGYLYHFDTAYELYCWLAEGQE